MTDVPDHSIELLVRLRGGDPTALADVFSHYRERLWRMVHFRLDERLTGRVDADDVLQEAYIGATERLASYLSESSMPLFVWLRLIVGQTLVDVHRRHLGAKMRSAAREIPVRGYPMASSASMSAHLLASLTSPSQAAIRDETRSGLQQALERMDPIDREVLVLRHFEELGNNEVAEILGLQKSAASNRYVRALARLKRILTEHDLDDDGESRRDPPAP